MKVVLALGSNLGDRESHIDRAIEELNKVVEVTHLSSLLETDPVGGPAQPNYLNAVAICESEITPLELLHHALRIETELGRTRAEKWGARIIDIDLIAAGDLVIKTAELALPHPLAYQRRFVLEPWSEIEPDAVLPGHGSISSLLSELE